MLKYLFATLLATVGFAQYDSLQAQGWVRLTTGVSEPFASLFVKNKDTVYATTPSAVLRTTDGGGTWDYLVADKPGGSIWFTDDTTGFFAALTNEVYKTTDGGSSWVLKQAERDPHYVEQMQFVGRDTGWVLSNGSIFQTRNGGESWRERPTYIGAFSFASATAGYGTYINEDSLERTTDGGTTWNRIHPNVRVGSTTIWALSVDTIIATTAGESVIRSTDAGYSWTLYNSDVGFQQYISTSFADHKQGWIVSRWGAITHTSDGGNSWHAQHNPTAAFLFRVGSADSLTAYVVGDSGVVLKTTNGGNSWVDVGPGRASPLNASCYPSPARDETLVSYRLETADRISLSIVDGQGKTVMTVADHDVQSPGPHTVRLDLSGLPSGAYTVHISGGHTRGAAKLAILR